MSNPAKGGEQSSVNQTNDCREKVTNSNNLKKILIKFCWGDLEDKERVFQELGVRITLRKVEACQHSMAEENVCVI